MGIHDLIIKEIKERLEEGPIDYDYIDVNLEYGRKRVIGEIDLRATYTTKKGEVIGLFFEMKSNHRDKYYRKARKQLMRHKRNFKRDYDRMYFFYVTPTVMERIIYGEKTRPKF